MKRRILISAFAILIAGTSPGWASTITFLVSAKATGSLGSTSFTNAFVTFKFVSDTSTAYEKTLGEWVNTGTGSVTIAGISGAAALTSGPLVFDLQGGATHSCSSSTGCWAGIGAGQTVGPTLFAAQNNGFLSYDLNTAIGPLSGASTLDDLGYMINTSKGGLKFTSVGTTLFTAKLSAGTTAMVATPEPSTFILFAVALLSLSGWIRYSKHALVNPNLDESRFSKPDAIRQAAVARNRTS
ncbi:MAG TPA: hypothetical protein VGZ29_03330 [Terriglobia bacterium]|nr:hypothetical protein [Terriglobia bacterium]